MTTKAIAVPKVPKQDVRQKDGHKQDANRQDEYLAVFPEYPPRGDMNNPIYLHEASHMRSLAIHFGRDETTLVMSEVPISTTATIRREHRRPDLIVAFNCDRDLLIRQKGYSIATQGKPPDFALEVASKTTGIIDETEKRIDYAAYGIREYWRYDQTGGDYHAEALAGDRLVEGEYKPIDVDWLDNDRCRGYSAVLNLYVCWEYGNLRWYDHHAGEYLLTFYEERDLRLQEAYEREQAEMRAEQAAFARRQEAFAREQAETRAEYAETRAEREAQAREQAETRADQAEAENRRLRAEMDAMRRRMGESD